MRTKVWRGRHYAGIDVNTHENSPSMNQVIPMYFNVVSTTVVTPSSITMYGLGFRQRKALRMYLEFLTKPNPRFSQDQFLTASHLSDCEREERRLHPRKKRS